MLSLKFPTTVAIPQYMDRLRFISSIPMPVVQLGVVEKIRLSDFSVSKKEEHLGVDILVCDII